MDQEDRPASAELLRLRAAAAAIADLDRPAHRGPADPAHDEADDADDGAGFDATAHADRFSELHDALVTVLADVDRG